MHTDRLNLALSLTGFVATLFILLTGPLSGYHSSLLLIQLFGLLLILWAFIAKKVNKHHHGNLAKGTFFIDKGPYEIIRHPMYAGFILILNGFVQGFFDLPRAFAFLLVIAVILAKVVKEEYLLEHHVKEYHAYKKKTYSLMPYIF